MCRFTPTRVGTTSGAQRTRRQGTVHPHARGDNLHCSLHCILHCGSPPRAWGQQSRSDGDSMGVRFTPTRVGTTLSFLPTCCSFPVHPHARGDNSTAFLRSVKYRGSPPRAWGQRRRERTNEDFTAVHPHARGDNRQAVVAVLTYYGSPPRAWGQHLKTNCIEQAYRFTPTRVGTT